MKLIPIFIFSLKAGDILKVKCPSEQICAGSSLNKPICVYDEDKNCIRIYKSMCHLSITGCRESKKHYDYSSDYCGMDGWLCDDPPYERWTLFFGH
ncbi:uncharacterized protein LOC26513721 isoform X2 [Drosophila ananassae]|uniref:uncharacterized protein LOC26513721 isoform X2 n=1 Tax=Drosophila ananassae TaxID=7217 RepID=UPI001CFFAB0E|nr:uncharacterized protein LOC26513721 isoform X2 [Drosophila ananassae]